VIRQQSRVEDQRRAVQARTQQQPCLWWMVSTNFNWVLINTTPRNASRQIYNVQYVWPCWVFHAPRRIPFRPRTTPRCPERHHTLVRLNTQVPYHLSTADGTKKERGLSCCECCTNTNACHHCNPINILDQRVRSTAWKMQDLLQNNR